MYEKMLLIMNWKGCKNKKTKVAYICVRNVSSDPLFSSRKNYFTRFEVHTGVLMEIQVLWDVMLCRPVNSKLQ